jgi:amino acid transporter
VAEGSVAESRTSSKGGLAVGAIGLLEVVFLAIAFMGPGSGIAFNMSVAFVFAGGAVPLAVLLAMVAAVIVANSIGQLARHMPTAGGFYTYAAQGIHPWMGFIVGWLMTFAYVLGVPIMVTIFGNVVGNMFAQELGWDYNIMWQVAAVAGATTIFVLNYLGVRVTTRTGVILGTFELVVMIAIAATLVILAGGNNTLSVFTTEHANVEGFTGFSGVAAASIMTIFAFCGFEAAAPLAEETENPRRNIALAVALAAIGVGAFLVFCTYAGTVWYGPDKMGEFITLNNGNPWDYVSRNVWGIGWILVFLAIANSTFASANGVMTAGSRMVFAMGRIKLLPEILGRTHPTHKTPHISLTGQYILTLVLALGIGNYYGPIMSFSLLGTIFTAILIFCYATVNLSCLVYYLRVRRDEFHWLRHLVLPIIGIAFFIPAFFTAIGIGKEILPFISPLPSPLDLTLPVLAIWAILGIAYLAYLAQRHPARIADTAKVFIDDPEPA